LTNNIPLKVSSSLLVLLLSPCLCLAQDTGLQDLTHLSVEDLSRIRLSTASRHLDDPRKAPASVTSIDADEIRKQGWQTLADLLRSVPGVYTAYDRTYAYMGVRGFLQSGDYNARVLLLIDGHRVNDNIYDSALIGTEFPLDMSLIDHVEIVRGPGSSLFGTNAELAVVNVFTKRPARQNTVDVAAEVRSQLGRVLEVSGSFRAGPSDGLVSGSIYRSTGASRLYFPEYDFPLTNNGIAEDLDGDRFDHFFGVLRSGQFRVEGLFGRRNKIVPNASYETLFNTPEDRSVDTRGYVDTTYSHEFGFETDLDLRLFYDSYRFRGSYPYEGMDATGSSVQINDAAADWIGFESVVNHRLGRHRVVGGGTGEYNLRLHQRNYYLGQPAFLDDRRHLGMAAVFGEAEVNSSPWFTVSLGGRIDWYYNTHGISFSPRIALMYLPSPRASFKYIYGSAFRAPDQYDQFFVDQIDITAANTHLRPETIHSQTVLFERNLSSWLRAAASGFQNDLNRIIEEESDPVTGDTHFSNQIGDRGRGLEVELRAKLRSGLSARSSYDLCTIPTPDPKDRSTRINFCA
jgi:outer membrane receptor for ferrienterochelin and colicins